MRLVDVVVGVRPGHVLVTHSSMIASVIASVIASMIAWLSLSLAIVAMVIAMKTLWTPVGVAVASVWMVGSSVAIAWLGEGEGSQRENL